MVQKLFRKYRERELINQSTASDNTAVFYPITFTSPATGLRNI